MKKRKNLIKALSYIFLSVSSFIMIYPVLFMALGSLMYPEQYSKASVISVSISSYVSPIAYKTPCVYPN